MSEDNSRKNPYTGMNMATSDNGNREVVKVEDLVNKPQKEWSQYTPVDTLENADSELASLNNELSELPGVGASETVKLEDIINKKEDAVEDKIEDLSLNNDELINNLTSVLNM